MYSRNMLEISRKLRKNMTEAEKLLWTGLRNNRLGVRFRRQMPIESGVYHYVADFYCREKRLIIELDGGIHDMQENKRCDIFREEVFKEMGFRVIRFKNLEIINNPEEVYKKISDALK